MGCLGAVGCRCRFFLRPRGSRGASGALDFLLRLVVLLLVMLLLCCCSLPSLVAVDFSVFGDAAVSLFLLRRNFESLFASASSALDRRV